MMSLKPRLFLPLILLALLALGGCKDRPAQSPASSTSAHVHDVAGETCFIEDAAKRDPGRLWCKEHGRYEDRCWECHSELRDADRPYCEEHGLYEDECFLCDPARGKAPAAGDAAGDAAGNASEEVPPTGEGGTELFCDEHQVPEHQCGVCQPQLADELSAGEALLVRLPSMRSAELAGLAVGHAEESQSGTTISLLGEVRYDGNRLARLTPLADGVIAEIRADVGQVVARGETLAVINSPAAAVAKAGYRTSIHTEQRAAAALARSEQLQQEDIGSRRALEEARAEHGSAAVAVSLARQGLLTLGLREAEIDGLGDSATSGLALRAPFAGTVVERNAVLGAAVTSGEALFEVADLSQMWVELSVPEEAAPKIAVGTPVQLRVRTLPSDSPTGQVTWVAPVVDEKTRMVRARAVVPNPHGALRQGMFADVSAVLDASTDSVLLPASAVHRLSDLPFVFVQQEADLFAARRVEVGDRLPSDEYVIRTGISADDSVVLTGGFTLKSALLASRLGAGCADD